MRTVREVRSGVDTETVIVTVHKVEKRVEVNIKDVQPNAWR